MFFNEIKFDFQNIKTLPIGYILLKKIDLKKFEKLFWFSQQNIHF